MSGQINPLSGVLSLEVVRNKPSSLVLYSSSLVLLVLVLLSQMDPLILAFHTVLEHASDTYVRPHHELCRE